MKNIRKITAILLSVVMLLTALPVTTFAATSGDYEYEILADGTAAITDYTGAGGDVTIPDTIDGHTVTAIGDSAFDGCSTLTTVEIPDSVTTIGYWAFAYCGALTTVEIPDSVRSIGSNAFHITGYYNQESNWENGVLYIGNHCIDAKSDEIPGEYTIREGTITIGYEAFRDFIIIRNPTGKMGFYISGIIVLRQNQMKFPLNIPSARKLLPSAIMRSLIALP